MIGPKIPGRPVNVLIVTAFDLDEPAGGVNTMIRTLNEQLSTACRVVILEQNWNAPRPLRRIVDGITRYKLRLRVPSDAERPVRASVGWLIHFVSVLRSLARILRNEAIDVVHLHYGAAYQHYFLLTRLLLGVPYVVTLHRGEIINFDRQPALHKRLTRLVVCKADRVVPVSRWLGDEATRVLRPMPQMVVIPNGIDLHGLEELYDPAFEASLPASLPARYFLMVSNVTHYKAQDVAIRAWAEVGTKHPDLRLLIVGEKRELWDDCVQLIEELGCGETVKLLGEQPRSTAINLMHRALALVAPSRSEGLPYVLLEAGAIGIPVICSDIGPFIEVVKHGETAFVTPVGHHHAIAEAVDAIISNPKAASDIGNALRSKIRAEYSAEQMAARYMEVYRQLVAHV